MVSDFIFYFGKLFYGMYFPILVWGKIFLKPGNGVRAADPLSAVCPGAMQSEKNKAEKINITTLSTSANSIILRDLWLKSSLKH